MRRYIHTIILILVSLALSAQGRFEVTPDIEEAYESIINLRFEEARTLIENIKRDDPENLLVYHIENYIDFFTIFINEDKDEYERLKKNKDLRIEKIKSGDKNSPYYRFSQAEILLQWSLARTKVIKLKDLTVFNDANKAYRLLEKNVEQFPQFVANKKSLSVIHAMASNVPSALKTVFRVRGDLVLGLEEIQEVVRYGKKNDFLFDREAEAIHAYMLLYLFNKPQDAWNALYNSSFNPNTSPLAAFLLSSIGLKTGKNDLVIEILSNRPDGQSYFPFHYLDFMLGKAKLFRMEADADTHIRKFIDNFKGRHFIKEAYQKLAWYQLVLNNDYPSYKHNMKLCDERGNDFLEDDQQAEKEAKSKLNPNADLLKARLLYDGGYYRRALDHLILNAHKFTASGDNQLEFNYRLGRISQSLKSFPEAIEYFDQTIALGKKRGSFFACNAALQVGLIHEAYGKKEDAIPYFKLCKSIKSKTYRNQLHKKAEAGITRLSK